MLQPALYWRFIRPFTLLVPATGMICGALMALGAPPKWESPWSHDPLTLGLRILAGALLAASLNAFSNGVNQIYDVELDRINKPHRLLPRGEISPGEAWGVSLAALLLALGLGAWINPETFWIVVAATFLTLLYSAPPFRTKRRLFLANLTIAIPRGTLLVVAGWSTVKSVREEEPWWIGAIFGLFFLGAVTTKDFSDMEGDRAGGCRTLPLVFGPRKAVWLIAPFFALPFLGILPALKWGLLRGNPHILAILGLLLPLWGLYIAYLLLRDPESLAGKVNRLDPENHPSWKHMYLLTLVAQCGFAAAYLTS